MDIFLIILLCYILSVDISTRVMNKLNTKTKVIGLLLEELSKDGHVPIDLVYRYNIIVRILTENETMTKVLRWITFYPGLNLLYMLMYNVQLNTIRSSLNPINLKELKERIDSMHNIYVKSLDKRKL